MDIVERLRAFNYRTDIDALEATDDLMMDAAAMIQRQREALMKARPIIKNCAGIVPYSFASYAEQRALEVLAAIDAVLGDGK